MTQKAARITIYCFVFIILAGLLAFGLVAAAYNGLIGDEDFYTGAGCLLLKYHEFNYIAEHPVFVPQLGVIPLLFFKLNFSIPHLPAAHYPSLINTGATGAYFLFQAGNNPYFILFVERSVIIIFMVLLGFLVFQWSKELYGAFPALLPLILYATCPTVIAHGSLFGNDIMVSLFFFLTVYRLKKFFDKPKPKKAFFVGVCFGLTLLSKLSGVLLIPPFVLLFIIFSFQQKESVVPPRFVTVVAFVGLVLLFAISIFEPLFLLFIIFSVLISCAGVWVFHRIRREPKRSLGLIYYFCFIALVAIVVIIADYFHPDSLINALRPLKHFIRILDFAIHHSVSTKHATCVEGSFVTCDWRYFISLLVIKVPVVTLCFVAAGIIFFLKSKQTLMTKLCVTVPPLFFLLFASFVNRINIGVRHVLPVFPFLFLMTGECIVELRQIRNVMWKKTAFVLISIFLLLSIGRTITFAPNLMPYFNEFVGTVDNGAKLTIDSNFSYGEENKLLMNFLKSHGIQFIKIVSLSLIESEINFHGIKFQKITPEDVMFPTPGYYVLDLPSYYDVIAQPLPKNAFKNRKPDFRVGHIFLVFKM